MRKFGALPLLLIIVSAHAVDAAAAKHAAQNSAKWLIAQFDAKEGVFGSGPGSKTPEQNAMVLKVLIDAPVEHKEAGAAYMTEPLKFIAGKINDDGSAKDIALHEPEALQWIFSALKVTGDAKYKDVIEKMRTRAKSAGELKLPEFDPSQLEPKTADAASMRSALFAAHLLSAQNKNDIVMDGKSVKWAEVLGAALIKLQQPDGSFGSDIQANAMALYALELSYKALK